MVFLSTTSLRPLLVLTLAALSGCTATQSVRLSDATRAEINARGERGGLSLVLEGERSRRVGVLEVGSDMTTWIDQETGDSRSAPTSSVESVTFRRDGIGAIKGAIIGAAVGGVLGVLRGVTDGGSYFDYTPRAAGTVGAIVGLEIGAISGALRSDREVYRLRHFGPLDPVALENTATTEPCGGIPLACAVLENAEE